MSYILKVVRPWALQNWVATNAPVSVKTIPRDSWKAYLAANGGVGATLRDLEMSFLATQLATGATLVDRWTNYLLAQPGGTPREKAQNKYR